ncbi:neuromedin-S preproprotein isoform B [Alligator mississippiensis]|uniref:Neuromedin-S preproprotein isoform B n=1 Tax=Alligator mississippiensis TaxID=8496 RepID=A0A151NXU4_ALLMI|nr:neuromedin-S preproprotein isoform B [Alligator mississippiensis]
MRLPQPGARHRHASDLPDSQQLALCFSQWTELNQPQISSSIMDLCNSIFNSMQIAEENSKEIYKRFLFHYSRAQDSAYPLKNGVHGYDIVTSLNAYYRQTMNKLLLQSLQRRIVLVPWDDPFFFSGLEMEELLKMVECRPSRRFPWSMKLTGRLLSP